MSEEPVECVWSLDRTSRANIIRRADGLLAVEVERLVRGDHAHQEPDYWSRAPRSVIVVDTLDRARELALEQLKALA